MFVHSLAARVVAGAAVALFVGSGAVMAGATNKVDTTTFSLFPQTSLLNCLKPTPSSPTPQATVTVNRGGLADVGHIDLKGFKPNLAFDLFTIQHSPQTATGAPDVNPSVGLAWYQTDVHVNALGKGEAKIRTILLDQTFGVDKDVALAPTNTFQVGFWFNNPADAAGCGFVGTTPFNGEHTAGPLAFVSRPDATTALGPLCTDPIAGTGGVFTCNP